MSCLRSHVFCRRLARRVVISVKYADKGKNIMIVNKWTVSCAFVIGVFVLLGSGDKKGVLDRPQGRPEEQCRIQNCHGLDIQCGFSQPMACTAMYQLGDFCRQFAECRVVDGECRFVSNDIFMRCKTCVQDCEFNKVEINPFVCEVKCRKEFEPYFYDKPAQ